MQGLLVFGLLWNLVVDDWCYSNYLTHLVIIACWFDFSSICFEFQLALHVCLRFGGKLLGDGD